MKLFWAVLWMKFHVQGAANVTSFVSLWFVGLVRVSCKYDELRHILFDSGSYWKRFFLALVPCQPVIARFSHRSSVFFATREMADLDQLPVLEAQTDRGRTRFYRRFLDKGVVELKAHLSRTAELSQLKLKN